MTRVLLITGGILLGVALLATLATWLAMGATPERSGVLQVDGLSAPVSIAWDDRGLAIVEASSPADLASGIGYVHAADYAWPMMFWRDAANGHFESGDREDDVALEIHVQRLGFSETAQQTYLGLDSETRALLDAYARGVNQALADPGVSQGDAFVLLDLNPAPWKPWDALSVEAVLAYLATKPIPADTSWTNTERIAAIAGFVRVDSLFRTRLGIDPGSAERSLAAKFGDSAELISHKPTGTSSLPAFVPMTLHVGSRTTVAVTVPGTLSLPVGSARGFAWSTARTSDSWLMPRSGALPDTLFSRIRNDSGDESLLAVARDSSGLLIARMSPAEPDSTIIDPPPPVTGWILGWDGFKATTDIRAFQQLLAGDAAPQFRLLEGVGVVVTGSEFIPTGSPAVTARTESMLLVSPDTLALNLARRLARLVSTGRVEAKRFEIDRVSTWARELLEPMLAAMRLRTDVDRKTEIPLQYLKSWRYEYSPDAIAPTIFEYWLRAHESITGMYPVMSDSIHVALLPYSLRLARAELRDQFGADHSTWRWRRLADGTHPPPVMVGQSATDRIAPTTDGGSGGHPTAFLPGPSTIETMPTVGPAVWTFHSELSSGTLFVSPPRTSAEPEGLAKRSHPLTGARLAINPAAPMPTRHLRLLPAR